MLKLSDVKIKWLKVRHTWFRPQNHIITRFRNSSNMSSHFKVKCSIAMLDEGYYRLNRKL